MLTFFLIDKTLITMLCLRAIINFIRLTIYNSHFDEILIYMQTTLHNIDRLKMIFKNSRSINKKIKRKYFNFFKFHVIIYYADNIRKFGNIVKINNSYNENIHKFIIKNFYNRINKHLNFNKQILIYNIRRQNIFAINNVFLYIRSKTITNANKNNVIKINIISQNSIKLRD